MRRIQEKLSVEKTIWQPVSVPMARFLAFEQMTRSAKKHRRLWAIFAARLIRTTGRTGSPTPNVATSEAHRH